MTTNAADGNGQAPTTTADPAGANGQAPTTAQANNGTTGSPASGASHGQAPTTTADDTYTPPSAHEWKRFQQELAEARRDAAKLTAERKAREDAQMSAQQKLERDFSELQAWKFEHEADVQRLHLELAGLRLAPTLNIADPAAAMALLQAEHGADLKFDASGKPENLPDLLKQVVRDHPLLAGGGGGAGNGNGRSQQRQPTGGGASNPGRQAGSGGLTRADIERMSMREKMARMAEIDAWRRANPDEAAQWAREQTHT